MKKASVLICAILIALIFLFVSPSNAILNSDVEKAKEYILVGMYPQAIELLNKRINDKPTDTEAHFQLGICFINTENYSKADERFASAVQLESDYGYKIGEEFMKAGEENLQNNKMEKAEQLFQKAIRYQPNLRDNIANDFFTKGESLLNREMRPYDHFNLAIKFNGNLSEKTCDVIYEKGNASTERLKEIYFQNVLRYCGKYDLEIKTYLCDANFQKGKSASRDDTIRYFGETKQYCNKYDKQISKHLLTIANEIDNERARSRYIDEIKEFLNESEIFETSKEYYAKKWGKPIKIELYKDGENGWIKVCDVRRGDRLHYISLVDIKKRDNFDKSIRTYRKQLKTTWGRGVRYSHSQGVIKTVEFHKDKDEAIVYVWLERDGRPVDLTNF